MAVIQGIRGRPWRTFARDNSDFRDVSDRDGSDTR